MIDEAFYKFDPERTGVINQHELRVAYDSSSHPKVLSGELCSDEVFIQFLRAFGDKHGDGSITKTEWDDYYSAVSSEIENDDLFILLVKQCWRLQ